MAAKNQNIDNQRCCWRRSETAWQGEKYQAATHQRRKRRMA